MLLVSLAAMSSLITMFYGTGVWTQGFRLDR
jgi:hypothetical protein